MYDNNHIAARERIIIAAKKEFAERGYAGARMGSIAKSAEVNQALIHYYFDNKENLYLELLHRVFNIGKFEGIPVFEKDSDFTPSQKLLLSIYYLVCLHHESVDNDFNLILSRDFIEARESLKTLITRIMIPRFEIIADIITEGMHTGEFETDNPLFVVLRLFTFVIFYGTSRKTFKDTPWEKKLYNDVTKSDLTNFVIKDIFKSVLPAGKELVIPEVPVYLFKLIDEIIDDIKIDIRGGMKND
ncbi:MAG: TetR/AcrR family transcriptional regulator [Ignavibacteria bacterium]|jgi:TetR/AcrR family transcriptional regulator|nr:TetR/AcrR family transcriptional regulator [Ignavibacteria bacterium]